MDSTTIASNIRSGDISLLDALDDAVPDVLRAEVIRHLDVNATTSLARVSRACRDAVWSPGSARSLDDKIRALGTKIGKTFPPALHLAVMYENLQAVKALMATNRSSLDGNSPDNFVDELEKTHPVALGRFSKPRLPKQLIKYAAVEFSGLVGRPELNGKSGRVTADFDAERERWQVMIFKMGETAMIKENNLTTIDVPVTYIMANDTPLSLAARLGYDVVVSTLITAGVDVNKSGHEGITPMHFAGSHGNTKILCALVDAGASVDPAGNHGIKPLHTAAQHATGAQVRVLIEAGANLESFTDEGFRPLHCAVRFGNESSVLALLDGGADVNAGDRVYGATALHHAAAYSPDRVICDHCVALIPTLIKYGAVFDTRAGPGFTPLHQAADTGSPRAASALLDHGANIETTSTHGFTPLRSAAHEGHLHMVQLLIAWKAKLDAVNPQDGRAALHLAARGGHTTIVQALVNAGGRVDVEDRTGKTPLLIAMQAGHEETARALIREGGPVIARVW